MTATAELMLQRNQLQSSLDSLVCSVHGSAAKELRLQASLEEALNESQAHAVRASNTALEASSEKMVSAELRKRCYSPHSLCLIAN